MRILHITGYDSKKYGGLEQFFVSLVSTSKEDHICFLYEKKPRSLSFVNDLLGCNGSCFVIESLYSVRGFYKFIKFYRQFSPDVVCFHFNRTYIPLVWFLGNTKIVCFRHSCFTLDNTIIDSRLKLPLKYRLRESLFNCFIVTNICVSQYVKKQYESLFGVNNNYVYLYLGVQPPKISNLNIREQLCIAKDTTVISVICFASPIKGLDLFLDAIKGLSESLDFKILIIGMDEKSGYTQMLKENVANNLVKKIEWIGIVDNISDYLSKTDIYVQPSRSEALSLAACEALSYGVPVIANNVGGLPEVASLLYSNSKELVEILHKLINDVSYRNTLGIAAYERYKLNFKMEKGVKKLRDIIVSLL